MRSEYRIFSLYIFFYILKTSIFWLEVGPTILKNVWGSGDENLQDSADSNAGAVNQKLCAFVTFKGAVKEEKKNIRNSWESTGLIVNGVAILSQS